MQMPNAGGTKVGGTLSLGFKIFGLGSHLYFKFLTGASTPQMFPCLFYDLFLFSHLEISNIIIIMNKQTNLVINSMSQSFRIAGL